LHRLIQTNKLRHFPHSPPWWYTCSVSCFRFWADAYDVIEGGGKYRLSGKYFSDSNSRFDYVTTYGAELQYKFNAAKFLNFFIGVNGGLANLKFRLPSESFSRTLKEPYFGGDIGTNIHLGKVVDLEFGGRVIAINGVNTISGTSVQVGNIISGYGSLIFKWQMD